MKNLNEIFTIKEKIELMKNKQNENGMNEIISYEEINSHSISLESPAKNFTPWKNRNYFVWKINYKYDFYYLSKNVFNILGYKPQELLGTNFFEIISLKNDDKFPSMLKNLDFLKFKILFLCKDQTSLFLQSNIIKKYNENDSLQGFEGISYSI